MELWIRSQDKDRLIKCQSLDILDRNQSPLVKEYLGNIELNAMIIGNDSVNLGVYLKERALEVLQQIQDFISKTDIEGNRYYKYDVFEMPEE